MISQPPTSHLRSMDKHNLSHSHTLHLQNPQPMEVDEGIIQEEEEDDTLLHRADSSDPNMGGMDCQEARKVHMQHA